MKTRQGVKRSHTTLLLTVQLWQFRKGPLHLVFGVLRLLQRVEEGALECAAEKAGPDVVSPLDVVKCDGWTFSCAELIEDVGRLPDIVSADAGQSEVGQRGVRHIVDVNENKKPNLFWPHTAHLLGHSRCRRNHPCSRHSTTRVSACEKYVVRCRDGVGTHERFEQGYADDMSEKSTAVTIPPPFG